MHTYKQPPPHAHPHSHTIPPPHTHWCSHTCTCTLTLLHTYMHPLPLNPDTDAHLYTHVNTVKQPILPPLHTWSILGQDLCKTMLGTCTLSHMHIHTHTVKEKHATHTLQRTYIHADIYLSPWTRTHVRITHFNPFSVFMCSTTWDSSPSVQVAWCTWIIMNIHTHTYFMSHCPFWTHKHTHTRVWTRAHTHEY